jgi:hypothetical protein
MRQTTQAHYKKTTIGDPRAQITTSIRLYYGVKNAPDDNDLVFIINNPL